MRVVSAAIGLMLVWQGLSLSLFIKATRRAWALLERHSDAKLQRVGVGAVLLGLLVMVCVT